MSTIAHSPEVLTEWSELRTQGPATKALGLKEVKNHLRLPQGNDYHDDLLWMMIDAAIERVENDTDRALITQTFQLWGHAFPQPAGYVPITRLPVQQIDSITYLDENDAQQTLSPSDYVWDAARRLLYPATGSQWPATNRASNSIVITFTAGSATAANIPAELLSAALLVITNLFYGIDNAATYEMLIGRYKRSRYP